MAILSNQLGLEGEFEERDLPLLIRRAGMAEWDDGVVRILDRRQLPLTERYLECRTVEEVAKAIEDMVIQGAFSLSIAAGYGLALAGNDAQAIQASAERLTNTRPTGLALHRMMAACLSRVEVALGEGDNLVRTIIDTANRAAADLARQGWKTGQRAASLLEDGMTILTHCFPDRSYAYLLMEARKPQNFRRQWRHPSG